MIKTLLAVTIFLLTSCASSPARIGLTYDRRVKQIMAGQAHDPDSRTGAMEGIPGKVGASIMQNYLKGFERLKEGAAVTTTAR